MPPACEAGWRRTDESTDADGVKCRVDSHAKGMSLQVVGNPLGCTKRIRPSFRPEPRFRAKQIYAFSASIRNSGAQIPHTPLRMLSPEAGWRRTDESTDADGVKCRVDSHAKGMSLQVVGNPLGCTKRIRPSFRPEPRFRAKQIYAFSASIRNSGAQIPHTPLRMLSPEAIQWGCLPTYGEIGMASICRVATQCCLLKVL